MTRFRLYLASLQLRWLSPSDLRFRRQHLLLRKQALLLVHARPAAYAMTNLQLDAIEAEFERRRHRFNGRVMSRGKPWAGEFPVDTSDGMDAAAIRILVANMRAGRDDFAYVAPESHCEASCGADDCSSDGCDLSLAARLDAAARSLKEP